MSDSFLKLIILHLGSRVVQQQVNDFPVCLGMLYEPFHYDDWQQMIVTELFLVCFSCIRGDFVKLFLHLERGEVNEYTPWSGLLCGGYSDVPHVFYSSGPGLVLEFHTDSLLSNSSGFIGTFRFIDRSKRFLHTYKLKRIQ